MTPIHGSVVSTYPDKKELYGCFVAKLQICDLNVIAAFAFPLAATSETTVSDNDHILKCHDSQNRSRYWVFNLLLYITLSINYVCQCANISVFSNNCPRYTTIDDTFASNYFTHITDINHY